MNRWLETLPGTAPPWTHVQVRALFAAHVDTADVRRNVSRFVNRDLAASASVDQVEDRDWVREWMRHARPLRFGKRLWVCPTSAALPAASRDSVLLRLDRTYEGDRQRAVQALDRLVQVKGLRTVRLAGPGGGQVQYPRADVLRFIEEQAGP